MGDGDNRRTIINQNVTSHNQSGRITAHTVNVDRRIKRTMTDEIKAGLLRGLPRDKPIQVNGNEWEYDAPAAAAFGTLVCWRHFVSILLTRYVFVRKIIRA